MTQRHSGRIYLLHGMGGNANGSVKTFKHAMLPFLVGGCVFIRPNLPHGKRLRPAEESVDELRGANIPIGSLLIGISMGGLVAAKLQESGRPDLQVIAISAPTWADSLHLQMKMENRIALYSSADAILEGRTSDWPLLAEAYDLPWLSHDTDRHMDRLASLVAACVNCADLQPYLGDR